MKLHFIFTSTLDQTNSTFKKKQLIIVKPYRQIHNVLKYDKF